MNITDLSDLVSDVANSVDWQMSGGYRRIVSMAAVDKCLAWGHLSGHICWLFTGKHGYTDEVALLQNLDLQENDPQLERRKSHIIVGTY